MPWLRALVLGWAGWAGWHAALTGSPKPRAVKLQYTQRWLPLSLGVPFHCVSASAFREPYGSGTVDSYGVVACSLGDYVAVAAVIAEHLNYHGWSMTYFSAHSMLWVWLSYLTKRTSRSPRCCQYECRAALLGNVPECL
ncbi:hypothetical protein BDP67DRAFT_564281 [Colletotrichum lupini]|nr:hypothetical protein BDP67DRAFT_564281 [Colletotrichum lupini]